MEILASPAALVGAASCIAVAGWVMGRWHGIAVRRSEPSFQANQHLAPGSAPALAQDHPANGALFSLTGNDDNAAPADCGIALSAMHDEITALRRRERVLANLSSVSLMLEDRSAHAMCKSSIVVHNAAAYAAEVAPPRERPQPSPGASPLIRV